MSSLAKQMPGKLLTLINTLTSVKVLIKTQVIVFLALIITACGGGSGEPDPVIVESELAFIKRRIDIEDLESDDLRNPVAFRPGAQLFLKTSAAPSAPSIDISSSAFSDPDFLNDEGELLYDIRDLNVSYDGTRLVFAMREPHDVDMDEEDKPTWNIWEYDTQTSTLRRIIPGVIEPEVGHDLSPAYLPDGRIVFASTRQTRSRAILLDEGKSQFAAQIEQNNQNNRVDTFNIHIMDPDGTNIRQITFNQSHDLDPIVLQTGMILFTRWDNAGPNSAMHLYEIGPDGTGLNYLYGRHSHTDEEGNTVQFAQSIEDESGRLISQVRAFNSPFNDGLGRASVPTVIDIENYVERTIQFDGTNAGEAQTALISGLDVTGASIEGSYGSYFPLYDGTQRALVTWGLCLVRNTVIANASEEACTEANLTNDDYEVIEPSYGLWLYDGTDDTQLPIELPESGFLYDEAVLLTSRTLASVPVAGALDETLGAEGYGAIDIRSVYDFDGIDTTPAGIATMSDPLATPPSQRTARFIRIEKPASQPAEFVKEIDNMAFGFAGNQLMREVVGYAPVEPDGSVNVAVPAEIAFAISVLDENGRRLNQRHQNWMHLAPGETLSCKGCHTRNSTVPHGRSEAGPESAYAGAPTTGLPFPNTNPALLSVVDMGDTMAQAYTRSNGIRRLTGDIEFEDEWTDSDVATPEASFAYRYDDLTTTNPVTTEVNGDCTSAWGPRCRAVINYQEHIDALWSEPRERLDDDGLTLLDMTCTACHTPSDAMGAAQVPAGQLDLTGGNYEAVVLDSCEGNAPANQNNLAEYLKTYVQLLNGRFEQEVVGGELEYRMVANGEFCLLEGEIRLDEDDMPIPQLVAVPVGANMSVNGANASASFFQTMEDDLAPGATVDHRGLLSGAELKMVSEWLDLGGQYYNDPFDAPE